MRDALRAAEEKRAAIAALGDGGDTDEKARLLAEAEHALEDVRLAGDLVIAAYFGAAKEKEREALRFTYESKLRDLREAKGDRGELTEVAARLRRGEHPLGPFHWEVEFPEVFSRKNPGFDAFVGNPPFAGKNTIAAGNRDAYLPWLLALHEKSHGASDLVAHFFRSAFNLLRASGTLGLVATNTIAQGDTRSTGLRWICTHGGTIYSATKRVKWPGLAAVVVSVVHVMKGQAKPSFPLDSRPVPMITAFLFHGGGHDDPARLEANAGKSFQGSIVLGMGFTFDDESEDATPIAAMHRLIEKDPRNAERIFPYIGGKEVNESATHCHRRYVINFGEMSEEEARRWPDLMRIVEERVRPERMKLGGNPDAERRRSHWWLWGRYTPALFDAIRGLDRVMVNALYSPYLSFTLLPNGAVFSNKLNVLPSESLAFFCALQCRVHEVWARTFSSTLKDDLAYAPSDCFETFPFPPAWESAPTLETAGREYYEFRAALMVRNDAGLTATYNRFHDPDEVSPDILRLRELHAAMDRAVLDAYGWTDIRPICEFLLDYEEADEDESGRARKRKKPWRYRWPDDVRDEVLARLLALNKERAEAERFSGGHEASKKKRAPRKKPGAAHPASGGDLFSDGDP